jgi:hypothetical protein
MTSVTYSERECAIESRQRADLECHVLTDVIDDPDIARGVLWIDPLAHDAAGVVNAERSDKKTSVRRSLGNDCSAAPTVDCAPLEAASIHRADRNT